MRIERCTRFRGYPSDDDDDVFSAQVGLANCVQPVPTPRNPSWRDLNTAGKRALLDLCLEPKLAVFRGARNI